MDFGLPPPCDRPSKKRTKGGPKSNSHSYQIEIRYRQLWAAKPNTCSGTDAHESDNAVLSRESDVRDACIPLSCNETPLRSTELVGGGDVLEDTRLREHSITPLSEAPLRTCIYPRGGSDTGNATSE